MGIKVNGIVKSKFRIICLKPSALSHSGTSRHNVCDKIRIIPHSPNPARTHHVLWEQGRGGINSYMLGSEENI